MSFDALAPHYRWMETVLAGGQLQRCRLQWLGNVSHTREALLAGEGTGRFLAACAKRLPHTQFTVVDASSVMIELARRAWAQAGGEPQRVTFVRAELPLVELLAGRFDLIVTHFFLDCFPPAELRAVIAQLAAAAATRADWLLADFCEPPHGFLRLRARAILRLAYAFFRAVTGLRAQRITPPESMLEAHGFRLAKTRITEWGLLHSDRWMRGLQREPESVA
jgi:SAM-dependent methyltransferase